MGTRHHLSVVSLIKSALNFKSILLLHKMIIYQSSDELGTQKGLMPNVLVFKQIPIYIAVVRGLHTLIMGMNLMVT